LRTHSFVFFAVHETRRICLSPFISKTSRRVSSFFLSVQLSQLYVATGHTSAFISLRVSEWVSSFLTAHQHISLIFVEIGMLWLFHIFCSDAPIAWPLFNLVWNSVVHSPSSVIRDPRYGNLFTCANCSFWMSMRHAMPSLAITLVLSISMSRLYLQLTRSRRSTRSLMGSYPTKAPAIFLWIQTATPDMPWVSRPEYTIVWPSSVVKCPCPPTSPLTTHIYQLPISSSPHWVVELFQAAAYCGYSMCLFWACCTFAAA